MFRSVGRIRQNSKLTVTTGRRGRWLLAWVVCMAQLLAAFAGDGQAVALADGVQATTLYEIHDTSDGRPRGTALVFHGGGWKGNDEPHMRSMDSTIERLTAQGLRVLNVRYRPGRASLADSKAAYDQAKRAGDLIGPAVAAGYSAGGHLASFLADRRPGIRAVSMLGSPTDLTALDGRARDLAIEAFGEENLGRFSTHLSRSRAPRVVGYDPQDELVDYSAQAEARREVDRLVTIRQANSPFHHGFADVEALTRFFSAQEALFDRALHRSSAGGDAPDRR